MPKPFKELSDLELNALGDDDLIAYIRSARDSGNHGAARLGLRIMVFGHMANVERRVAMKVPPHAVETVAQQAFDSAFTAAFDGKSVGEFRKWLNTIVNRRIVDYLRRKTPVEQPLEGDDDEVGSSRELAVEDDTSVVEAQSVVDQVMSELNPTHQRVIDLYVFSDEEPSAAEVARRVTEGFGTKMSPNNVHKITERFRKRVKELLRDGGDTGGRAHE